MVDDYNVVSDVDDVSDIDDDDIKLLQLSRFLRMHKQMADIPSY